MSGTWIWLSGAMFVFGIVYLVVSGAVFAALGRAVTPLLGELKTSIQELGDQTTNTIGSAAETMDLVEARVTASARQAVEAGATVREQTVGVGLVMAGVYVATRIVALFRGSRR